MLKWQLWLGWPDHIKEDRYYGAIDSTEIILKDPNAPANLLALIGEDK